MWHFRWMHFRSLRYVPREVAGLDRTFRIVAGNGQFFCPGYCQGQLAFFRGATAHLCLHPLTVEQLEETEMRLRSQGPVVGQLEYLGLGP